MEVIIFAIIKDEHHYIEEWVEYHHKIGIDHIYLLEDIDSKSHQELLSKYDYVTLTKLIDVINDDDRNDIINKIDKVHLAYKIFYRLYKDKCDWCAFIDVDEFIMCDNIKDVLQTQNDKPCLTMSWLIMKSMGYITHPNHWQKYSVLETYTDYNTTSDFSFDGQVKQIINCNPNFYDIIKFDNWEKPPHVIKEEYNNFYGDIKLKHFICKSFEEYVSRLQKRGECSNGDTYSRNYLYWIYVNDELMDYKDYIWNLFNIKDNWDNIKYSNYNI